MPLDLTEILAAIAIITVGATIQATVGFGLGLVAAPILLLIDPRFVPAPLMASGVVLTLLVAYRDRQGIDFIGLKFALWGRLFGMVPAALVLSVVSQTLFDLIFALLILLAVLLSALNPSVKPTNRRAIVAGAASGFMGTISGIGGPPIALLYQRSRGRALRGTLSGYFSVGASLSLLLLAAIGRCGIPELLLALLILPGIFLGFAISIPLASRLERTNIRPMVLGLSSVSAVAVLVRAIRCCS